MALSRQGRERGEGKIGCMLSLLVLVVAGAAVFKLAPVLYGNSSLQNEAGDLANRAGLFQVPVLEQELKAKARDLNIPEALAPGAVAISTQGDPAAGVCTIRLHYRRVVDFYGLYSLNLDTDKTITKPYMDAR